MHHLSHLSSSPRPPLTVANRWAHRISWRTAADPPLTVSSTHPIFPSTLKLRLSSLYLLQCPRTLPLPPATTGARCHHRKHRSQSPFPSPHACSVSRVTVLLARRTHRGQRCLAAGRPTPRRLSHRHPPRQLRRAARGDRPVHALKPWRWHGPANRFC
jgi:hypothetical protein